MTAMERFEMPDDFANLFGASVGLVHADVDFVNTFLSTFMERVAGQPRTTTTMPPHVIGAMDSLPAQVKRVALPLTVKATVVCLPTGIPRRKAAAAAAGGASSSSSSSVRLPSNARSTDYKQVLKFPTGGAHLLFGVDTTFIGKLCTYVVDGQKPKMLQLTDHKCACCGKFADGFVCTTKYERIDMTNAISMQRGATLNIQRAFPACKRTECNHKLRDYVAALQNMNEDSVLIICEYCKKAEERDREGVAPAPKFPVCSRCKIRYYCSKECQKADWAVHKQMCFAPKKSK